MSWLTGERVLAMAFAVFGLLFTLKARDLDYMGEFAPGAGFLPFWLGLILFALVIGHLVATRASTGQPSASGSGRKVFAVSAGLAACVGLINWIGFAVAIAAYLLYLARWVERRSWGLSVGLAAVTTLSLYLIFRLWLGVPLPRGPWGF
jgi:hypothetical protein